MVDNDGFSMLHIAVGKEHEWTVEFLLRHESIDINLKDGHGRTALGWASINGSVNIVQALLNHNDIRVNVADSQKMTPIGWAAYFGHAQVLELLLTAS